MAWTSGTLTYGYTAKIDLTDIVEQIIAELPGENNEWYLDGEDIVIRQDVNTGYKAWNCRATLECPEEHEVELDTMVFDNDVYDAAFTAFKKVKKIFTRLYIDDECDWDFPEPYDPYYDDNDAYDRWRDAYYDREYAERGSEEE